MTKEPYVRDLETIVTCLEISALELSPKANALFSKEALFNGAEALVPLYREDMEIVFRGMGRTVKKVKGGYVLA